MAKAIDSLKDLLAKCGVKSETIAKITGDDITDEVANEIKAVQVLTKESALANPEIRSKIRAEALDGVDADLDRLMGVHGLSDEEKAEIKKLDKTNLRIEKFLAKKIELTEKAAGASGKAKTELEKDLVKLNETFAAERKTWEQKYSQQEIDRLNDKVEWAQEAIYNGLPYAMKDLPKEVNISTAKTLMQQYANDKGAKFTMTDKGLALVTKEGTPYFDEKNVSPTAQDFITRALNEKKFLAVSNAAPEKQEFQQQQTQNPYRTDKTNPNKTVNFDLIDKAKAEIAGQ